MTSNRDEERNKLVAEAEAEQRLQNEGVVLPVFNEKEIKIQKQVLRIAAIAKSVAKSQIGVKVMRGGKFEFVVEPVGNEDLILQQMLSRLLGSNDLGASEDLR